MVETMKRLDHNISQIKLWCDELDGVNGDRFDKQEISSNIYVNVKELESDIKSIKEKMKNISKMLEG